MEADAMLGPSDSIAARWDGGGDRRRGSEQLQRVLPLSAEGTGTVDVGAVHSGGMAASETRQRAQPSAMTPGRAGSFGRDRVPSGNGTSFLFSSSGAQDGTQRTAYGVAGGGSAGANGAAEDSGEASPRTPLTRSNIGSFSGYAAAAPAGAVQPLGLSSLLADMLGSMAGGGGSSSGAVSSRGGHGGRSFSLAEGDPFVSLGGAAAVGTAQLGGQHARGGRTPSFSSM
jgi:hypothetical protein